MKCLLLKPAQQACFITSCAFGDTLPGSHCLYHHGTVQVKRNETSINIQELSFRFFENIYFLLVQSVLQEIVKTTSCRPPCSYTEYRFDKKPSVFGENNVTRELVLWLSTPYMLLETEQYLYPFKSLVADVGGILGLFLGFSLMTVWDIIDMFTVLVHNNM